jgi:hypothetical protein
MRQHLTDEEVHSLCAVCDEPCYYWEVNMYGEVIDSHWSHLVHPDDDHDAVPVL